MVGASSSQSAENRFQKAVGGLTDGKRIKRDFEEKIPGADDLSSLDHVQ